MSVSSKFSSAYNCVCYQVGFSEHSRANWERGIVVFLALSKHYQT